MISAASGTTKVNCCIFTHISYNNALAKDTDNKWHFVKQYSIHLLFLTIIPVIIHYKQDSVIERKGIGFLHVCWEIRLIQILEHIILSSNIFSVSEVWFHADAKRIHNYIDAKKKVVAQIVIFYLWQKRNLWQKLVEALTTLISQIGIVIALQHR